MRPFTTLALLACAAAAPAAEDFFAEAEARIERHRKQDAILYIHDRDGNPLPGARVRVRQTGHAFAFGSQVDARVWGKVDDDDPYRRAIVNGDFNTAVLGNGLKWYAWDRMSRRAESDRAIRWFRDHGLRVRGHTMVWGTDNWGVAGSKDIKRHVERIDEKKNTGYRWKGKEREDYVKARMLRRIRNLATHYDGTIRDWDVLNEPTSEGHWQRLLDPGHHVHASPLMVDWFHAARDAAGPGVRLAINEFHILVGDFPEHRDGYADIIRFLLDHDAPLDAIGFQGHFYNGNRRRSPAQMWAVLERFARFGLPMFVSEFDCAGKNWGEDPEATQAEFLREVLVTCFSHPLVDGFVIWGYWDGSHWLGNAPFYREDWSEKPSLAVWRELIHETWRTELDDTTDEAGRFAFRGFKGGYEITVEAGEETFTAPLVLGDEALEQHFSAR